MKRAKSDLKEASVRPGKRGLKAAGMAVLDSNEFELEENKELPGTTWRECEHCGTRRPRSMLRECYHCGRVVCHNTSGDDCGCYVGWDFKCVRCGGFNVALTSDTLQVQSDSAKPADAALNNFMAPIFQDDDYKGTGAFKLVDWF
jgi:hypothetical protein